MIKCVMPHSYQLNIWDVGGQRSLRSYWRNYFESTDGLIWVSQSLIDEWFTCYLLLLFDNLVL